VTAARIESLDDPRVAPYRDLREGRLLAEQDCFVAESRHVVRRLLASGRFPVRSLFVTEAALADLAGALAPLETRPPVLLAEHALLCEVAGYHVHQGCLALAERGAEPSLEDVARAAASGSGLLVGLEQLTDPANVGSVFRNALAFGASAVLMANGGAHPLFRKSVRVSMAATLAVPFARAEPWPAALGKLRAEGFVVLACVAQPDALELRSFGSERPLPERVVLLFGAEGSGLSATARAAADFAITVPTAPGVDSLNVATASGIVLHHFSRVAGRRPSAPDAG
jgi:tRNA G18 (ribose-2'-O)-methylase SpoU